MEHLRNFGSIWEMYTPHFFSKIQMLLGPNLAHLLSAQDQGGTSSLAGSTWRRISATGLAMQTPPSKAWEDLWRATSSTPSTAKRETTGLCAGSRGAMRIPLENGDGPFSTLLLESTICLSANQNDLIWWKRIKWTAVLGWMTCVHDMNSSNFIEIQKFWKVELKPHKRQHFAGQQETKLSQYPYIQLPASSIYECLQWPWLIGGTTKGKFCLMGLKRGWGEED